MCDLDFRSPLFHIHLQSLSGFPWFGIGIAVYDKALGNCGKVKFAEVRCLGHRVLERSADTDNGLAPISPRQRSRRGLPVPYAFAPAFDPANYSQ